MLPVTRKFTSSSRSFRSISAALFRETHERGAGEERERETERERGRAADFFLSASVGNFDTRPLRELHLLTSLGIFACLGRAGGIIKR